MQMPPGVEPNTVVIAIAIVLAAAVVKGTTGFGFALVSTPLLLLFWEPKVLVPIFLPLSIIADVLIVAQTWRRVEWMKVLPLITAGIAGVPVGVYLLYSANRFAEINGLRHSYVHGNPYAYGHNNCHLQRKTSFGNYRFCEWCVINQHNYVWTTCCVTYDQSTMGKRNLSCLPSNVPVSYTHLTLPPPPYV